ncbi:hypothetical protein OAO87_02315 [bacterium]|nr:hypothetical protein [bacterium]
MSDSDDGDVAARAAARAANDTALPHTSSRGAGDTSSRGAAAQAPASSRSSRFFSVRRAERPHRPAEGRNHLVAGHRLCRHGEGARTVTAWSGSSPAEDARWVIILQIKDNGTKEYLCVRCGHQWIGRGGAAHPVGHEGRHDGAHRGDARPVQRGQRVAHRLSAFAIMRLEGFGWCIGKLEAQNKDRRFKIKGKIVNFIAKFEIDEGTSKLALQLSGYDSSADAEYMYDSWLLLEPTETD